MYANIQSVPQKAGTRGESGGAAPETAREQVALDLRGISKSFARPGGAFVALDAVDLRVRTGQLVAIIGSSGSGKSTLLNVIAGLDRPTGGRVVVGSTDLATLDESGLATFRGANVGVVFQFFQLLPTLTARENLLLAMDLVGVIPPKERKLRATELLTQVGVNDQADKFPAALSGGQQQRVAIARALANDPPLLVADEPTGNLDSQTAQQVFQLLVNLARAGKTVLVVTHERQFPVLVDQTIELRDGRVVAASLRSTVEHGV